MIFSTIAQPIPQLSGHIHHPMLHSLSTVALFSYPFRFLMLCHFSRPEVGWVHGDANVTSQGWLRLSTPPPASSSSLSRSALGSAPHSRSSLIACSHNDALQAAGCHFESKRSCLGSQGQQLGEDAEIVCSVLMFEPSNGLLPLGILEKRSQHMNCPRLRRTSIELAHSLL